MYVLSFVVLNHWKIQNSGDSQYAINSIRRSTNHGERRNDSNDVSLLWRHSSAIRSRWLERAYRRLFLAVLGK